MSVFICMSLSFPDKSKWGEGYNEKKKGIFLSFIFPPLWLAIKTLKKKAVC